MQNSISLLLVLMKIYVSKCFPFFYFLFCCGIIHKQKFWQSPPLLVPVHVPVLNYRVLFFVCSDNLVHVLVSNDLPTKVAKLSDILVLTRCCSTLLHAAAYQNVNLYQMEPLHGCQAGHPDAVPPQTIISQLECSLPPDDCSVKFFMVSSGTIIS